jgi:hypothetical protein
VLLFTVNGADHMTDVVRKKTPSVPETTRKPVYHIPFSYSLTHSWSRALLEKPPIVQLLKSFPAFYGTRKFITVFTRALHWSLS